MSTFVFFADDWGRHPSSSQYLAKELAKHYRVVWVNSVGMRRPRLDGYTWGRGLEKIGQWIKGQANKARDANIRVVDPVQIPDWRSRISRLINAKLIQRHIRQLLDSRWERIIGITALPLPPEWLELIPCDGWIYYCVDNFSDWPGLDGQVLRCFESYLVRHASIIVTVSEVLWRHIYGFGRNSYVLPHGIDLERWQLRNCDNQGPGLCLPKPAVVWWGLVDERLDWEWITHAAESLDRVQLVFLGKVRYRPAHIARYKNIHFLGSIEASQLPAVAKQTDVLMMPYADTAVTRAMQPLKLLEYLASGKPIVARSLPALARWGDLVIRAENKYEFVSGIKKALGSCVSPAELAHRWKLLQQETWEAKGRQLIAWLQGAGILA